MSLLMDQTAARERARRAREVYQAKVRPLLSSEDKGLYVAVNVDTGDFEKDADSLAALVRIPERSGPDAHVHLFRAGFRTAAVMGYSLEANQEEGW